MGTGDYICVTLRGGAPWGFTLREGERDTYRPFIVSQAGIQEGDEVVSVNGEPCADLTLLEAFDLIDTSIDCLQLLLKRYQSISSEDYESEGTYSDERASAGEASESTTLHIFSPKHRSEIPRELHISESQDEAYCVELDSDTKVSKGPQLLCTELHTSSSDARSGQGPILKTNDDKMQRCFSSGEMVELQVSMAEQTLDDLGCTSLGSARGFEGEISSREAIENINTTITTSHYVPSSLRQPLSQHGVVISPSMQGQVEVIFQQPGAGRGILSVGGPRVSESVGTQSEGEEGGGGYCEGVPGSFSVSFEIHPEDATAADEQDSDSEGDQDKPNKHRARHARLRRSESLSEKQVKEAKSKCKRIALLLTAAPPNPNNKGVLMFKKHRQRVKKYTLVSYGTGEDEPTCSDEEDEDNGDDKKETSTVEFTFVASTDSEIDKHFLTNANNSKGVLTLNWDKGLLEIERSLNNQTEMECLPETKGKGALMFAQRRQRMDEISAEHDELRRQGMPVEGVQEVEKKVMEHSYIQSATEGHQQQMQHYSTNINGTVQHQTNEMQSSFSNRTAKPFTAENMVAIPYSHAMSGTNQESVGQGEQIASRDERISTPAIRTGILLDTRRKTTGKPMFTFKDAPKVSPNPALLNLLNRSDKKLGFESGPEEDYLSLGAEACNFLQSQRVKHKTPPPVAPKPVINPNSPPWSPQIEPTPAPAPEPSPPPAQPETLASTTPGEQQTWTLPEPESQQQPPQAAAQEANGSAFEMPAVRGKGADMFAKRQSRMEKFVVDSETVEANKVVRSTSPAASLPNEWKYTPNVRAPPPRAYNPIQSPSYPPAATKQHPSSSPSTKAKKKDKEKPAPAPKPLNVIDVMKHQPYQLNSSLFIFGPGAEATKPAPPKPSISPPNPPVDNQPVTYEQMAPVQPAGPFGAPYPQQTYGIFPVAARPESTSGGNTATAPKPKFTAKKSSAQAVGRSYSLSPPARVPFTGQKSASASSSPRPLAQAPITPQARQTSWMEKGHKPPTPWEAASRHPFGLVDEAFAFQNLQQTLASNVRLAAQRKMLPEPPAEWKAGVPYRGPQKTGSQTWSQSQSRSQTRAPLPSFLSPTRSPVSTPVSHAGYRSLPRQWQPQKPVMHANPRPSVSLSECQRPLGRQNYKSVYTSNTWSWRR
uniref:Synaptopodin 2 n=1 Tax=Acanthochromis polyacanthus TaxID=80966 RepID=A0A3Q1EKN5_9TELE